MRAYRGLPTCVLISFLTVATESPTGWAQQAASVPGGDQRSPPHDGSRDFDWEIGLWKTHLKRRLHPLTGSNEWVEYQGTTTVRKIWSGRANIVELDVSGPAGRIEGASWRLYNPEAQQWSLNFANVKVGTLGPPTIGEFSHGRGEFYSAETLDGRAILVRFVISAITPASAHFEQAFSSDGGHTWETNWVADDTRLKE
jgi:hypothetical protein